MLLRSPGRSAPIRRADTSGAAPCAPTDPETAWANVEFPRRSKSAKVVLSSSTKPRTESRESLSSEARLVYRTSLSSKVNKAARSGRLSGKSRRAGRSDLDYLPGSPWPARRHLEKRDREQIMCSGFPEVGLPLEPPDRLWRNHAYQICYYRSQGSF